MLTLHVNVGVCAQQQQQEDSLEQDNEKLTTKYWFYRHRLVTQFLKVGLGENGIASGYSLPAVQAYTSQIDQLHFGDGTSFLGNYIGVLATEHLLLKRDSASEEKLLAVKEELYYAMMAYERLDFNAEHLLKPYTKGEVNGFFIRDDVDAKTYLKGFPTPLDVTGKPKSIISDYTDAKYTAPCDKSPLRFPTVDQISNLMVGFALVVKCMDEESYQDFRFKENAKYYTHVIMKYLQNVDYIIAHPTEHCTVAYAEDARLIAYGLAQAGEAIREERFGTEPVIQLTRKVNAATAYDSWNTFLSASVWINTLNYPAGKAFFKANFMMIEEQRLPIERITQTINEHGIFGIFDAHDYNNAIVCQLAAIGNVWKVGLMPHNRTLTLGSIHNTGMTKRSNENVNGVNRIQRKRTIGERKISLSFCCYDGTLPQQLLGLASAVTNSRVPFSDLSAQILTALPVFCMPGHDVLPQMTINTTALALSKYGDISDIQYFAVLHEFLHGTGVYDYDKNFLITLLKAAPETGPHYKPFLDPDNPPSNNDWTERSESEGSIWWRQDSRWEKCSRNRASGEGAWNGLDYMIAYNLFHLVHGKTFGLKHYATK